MTEWGNVKISKPIVLVILSKLMSISSSHEIRSKSKGPAMSLSLSVAVSLQTGVSVLEVGTCLDSVGMLIHSPSHGMKSGVGGVVWGTWLESVCAISGLSWMGLVFVPAMSAAASRSASLLCVSSRALEGDWGIVSYTRRFFADTGRTTRVSVPTVSAAAAAAAAAAASHSAPLLCVSTRAFSDSNIVS